MAKRTPRKSGGRRGGGSKSSTFEVEDSAAPKGPGASLEDGLVWVTLVALVVGLVAAQIGLAEYGAGLL